MIRTLLDNLGISLAVASLWFFGVPLWSQRMHRSTYTAQTQYGSLQGFWTEFLISSAEMPPADLTDSTPIRWVIPEMVLILELILSSG